ncbi:plastocyanin/azurin family copper-binding protein [Halorussus amylolyticus]|uniref:plastocyanin/azurin family copper-binding protein n=1 Tax=Halorussus amylolyticus TaxID=1126242 RepID=UPI00104B72BA|nr:plastocyanin/azurin family copper-binding protein [Halorussus amylolyticus]
MKRREFLMAASGVAGGAAAGAQAVGAQDTTTSDGNTTTASGNETTTAANETATGNESDSGAGGGGGGGGPTEEVTVGPGGSLVFEPAELTIEPGTTVQWVWDSDNHNVVPSSQPDDADWSGTEGGDDQTYDTGHEYEHTFEVEGDYEYYCTPHETAGMVASITVQEGGGGGGGGGTAEEDPEHMGVAFQAHFVGLATILMVVVSLVYTFFTVKYGESPHAKGGN